MGLFLGADQVDVEGNEELPGTCDGGAPTGDKGAGAEVRRPLGLLELQEHSREKRWRGPDHPILPRGEKWPGGHHWTPSHLRGGTFSGRASYSPARIAGRVWRLGVCAASP